LSVPTRCDDAYLQRALERHPSVSPRIISDNEPQFIARDFKEFIRICGITHNRTLPYYLQSNGKIERSHRLIKSECIRPGMLFSMDDTIRLVESYVRYYNKAQFHNAIGYVTPLDKMCGRDKQIFADRDHKLEAARRRYKAAVRAQQPEVR
jgi:transposase InsO family protein